MRLVSRARSHADRAVHVGLRGCRLPAAGRASPRGELSGVGLQCGGETVWPRSRRPEEACDARGLKLVDRNGALDAPGLIPDAEADVRILIEVARDAERLPLVAWVRGEELDELAPQRRSAPGTEAEPSSTLPP